MAKAILFKPFPMTVHAVGWIVYLLWIAGVNVFKYGWGHVWVIMVLLPVMIGIFYFNWYALRRFFRKGMAWKSLGLPLLYFLLLLWLGYQVLYGFPNRFAGRVLRSPEDPAFGFAIYFIEVAGFYWAFAYKGLGVAAAEMMFNLLRERFAYITGKRQDFVEERKHLRMRRWIAHFLGNMTTGVVYSIRKGRASTRLFEAYGVIWTAGLRMMARENNFLIPLELELYHLKRLTRIYPTDALQIQVNGETGNVQVVPMVLLALYKNMHKHGDLQAESDWAFTVDCMTDRLIVTTKNRVSPQSAWVYEEGRTGLKQLQDILVEQYGDRACMAYKTDSEMFFLQIEIVWNNGRVQNNFETSGWKEENTGCRVG